jgi:CBS domain-containing protein
MSNVKEVLDKKGYEFYCLHPENTVYEALQIMAEKNTGSVMIVENNKLVGMFTERDYARKIVLHGLASKNSLIGDFMTRELFSVHSETSINDCMAIMTSKHIRHLPVVDADRIVGLISIGDVVNSVIHQQNIIINDLESYIYGFRSK